MRLLIAADIHEDVKLWNEINNFVKIESAYLDAVILAGDLTNLGLRLPHGVDLAKNEMEKMGRLLPVFYIFGNHDLELNGDNFNPTNCVNVDRKTVEFKGYKIRGVTATPCFDVPEWVNFWREMYATVEEDTQTFDFEPVDILVSHGPPLHCLDLCSRHVGSPALRDYIFKYVPKAVITGHIHECGSYYTKILDTTIYNTARSWKVIKV